MSRMTLKKSDVPFISIPFEHKFYKSSCLMFRDTSKHYISSKQHLSGRRRAVIWWGKSVAQFWFSNSDLIKGSYNTKKMINVNILQGEKSWCLKAFTEPIKSYLEKADYSHIKSSCLLLNSVLAPQCDQNITTTDLLFYEMNSSFKINFLFQVWKKKTEATVIRRNGKMILAQEEKVICMQR